MVPNTCLEITTLCKLSLQGCFVYRISTTSENNVKLSCTSIRYLFLRFSRCQIYFILVCANAILCASPSVRIFDPFCKCICFRNITNGVPLKFGYNISYIAYIILVPEKIEGVCAV